MLVVVLVLLLWYGAMLIAVVLVRVVTNWFDF